jgi:ABC-type dipeptide/oligopeptide/nickel transport system ATPase component
MSQLTNNTIIRTVKRQSEFALIDKYGLNDDRLTWKAKGLLAYLLSLPDDWKVYVKDLQNRSKDGRDAVVSGIQELLEFGYMSMKRVQGERGRFAGVEYTIYERPISEMTVTGFSGSGSTVTGFSVTGQSVTNNNNLTNNQITNNNKEIDRLGDQAIFEFVQSEEPKPVRMEKAAESKPEQDVVTDEQNAAIQAVREATRGMDGFSPELLETCAQRVIVRARLHKVPNFESYLLTSVKAEIEKARKTPPARKPAPAAKVRTSSTSNKPQIGIFRPENHATAAPTAEELAEIKARAERLDLIFNNMV